MSKDTFFNKYGVKVTRFLLAMNKAEKDLYILHREFPRCLIYVEQTIPMNFVVFDMFELKEDEKQYLEVLTSEEFKADLKQYVSENIAGPGDLN